MSELEQAVAFANKVLENDFQDPDRSTAVLARQFMRSRETVEIFRTENVGLRADIERLAVALESARRQIGEQSDRANAADSARIVLEGGKIHRAFSVDVQEHRDQAYKTGWDDGYAEGFGRAALEFDCDRR